MQLRNSSKLKDNSVMKFILYIYLTTTSMKKNWKSIVLYVIRVIELILTGAAGGAASQMF